MRLRNEKAYTTLCLLLDKFKATEIPKEDDPSVQTHSLIFLFHFLDWIYYYYSWIAPHIPFGLLIDLIHECKTLIVKDGSILSLHQPVHVIPEIHGDYDVFCKNQDN